MLNVTSDKGIFDITKKEITIPLSEYTDLIAKEAMLSQIRHAVSKESEDYGTIGIAVPMSQKQRTIKVHHIQVHCSTEKERLQSEDFIEEVTYGELQENEGSDD